MNKELLGFFVACAFPIFIFGQSTVRSCNKIKSGTFYFYPENNKKGFIIIREKDIQSEINLTTSDTSFWQIFWKNKCEFNLKFIRKSRSISSEEKNFYDAHVSVVRVLKVTKDYCVFKAGLDSLKNTNTAIDTLWFKARVN